MTAPQLALPSGERRSDPSITVYGVLTLAICLLVVIGTLAGAYLAMRTGTSPWPPKGVTTQEYYDNTLLVTAFIGVVAGWWGLFGIIRGERRQAVMGLALAIFMDAAFINLLTYVVRESHLSPRQDAYAVVWYALVIAIAAAYATGIGVGAVVLARTAGGQVTPSDPTLGWCAAWYGTFIALMWLVMYYLVHVVQ